MDQHHIALDDENSQPNLQLPPPPSKPLINDWLQQHNDPLDIYDDDLALHSDTASSSSSSSTDPPPMNYFVHNGFRYDGDLFQLRPPQERSIASRPERILEHKPALLTNRQTFNRVYSEGTYNARPSSLRSPRRSATPSGTTSPPTDLILDPTPVPAPVTRPGSIRPPVSPLRLCKTIEAVRQSASTGNGNQNLQGLLAYSAIPVTKISGSKPQLVSKTASATVPSSSLTVHEPISKQRARKSAVSSLSARVEEYDLHADFDPIATRHTAREKRGRSYTTFAKNTPFVPPSKSGKLQQTHSASAAHKRSSFWKGILLSR